MKNAFICIFVQGNAVNRNRSRGVITLVVFVRVLLISLVALTVSAQTIADPAKIPEQWKSFERRGEAKLACRVHPIQPRLNLGFRFQTGYSIEIPMRQYSGAGHWWSIVFRVTPEANEREPVWFISRKRIPPGAGPKVIAEFGGAYLVGEGRYKVDMLLVDDSDRVCSTGWKMRAKLNDQVRNARPGMPPGAVDDLSLRRSRHYPSLGEGEEARYNVSILMHAAATLPNRVRLQSYDRMLLMSALSSILERLPVRNVRLTIFNLDQQKELYHTAGISGASFHDAIDSLNGLELGTVDYSTLQNRTGHVDLVSDLLQRELAAKDRPDLIVFLGPLAHWTGRVADEQLPSGNIPPVYNIQLRPWRFSSTGLHADTIESTVRKLGGRTKQVYSPQDFAEAIQEVERILSAGRART
jgi:hypothetical protein